MIETIYFRYNLKSKLLALRNYYLKRQAWISLPVHFCTTNPFRPYVASTGLSALL